MAVVLRKDRFTSIKKQPLYYSDISTNFEKEIGTNNLIRYENIDAVKNSIKNIVLTNTKERMFNPTFGCDVRRMLFENIDSVTETTIQKMIQLAIENYEPRAKLLGVLATPDDENNGYYITITFTTINRAEPETLELILTRVR